MSSPTSVGGLYLDICAEFIENRFGKNLGIIRQPDFGYLHVDRIAPLDGGKVCKFDEPSLTWFACEQDSTYWNIGEDGEVRVGYPADDPREGVQCFHVGHPREVAELIHLFVQPSKRLVAGIAESRFLKLGNIADLYAVIPSGNGWRVLDLARLPDAMPEGIRTALALNLTRNWERLTNSEGCRAWELKARWPDFVGGLPDAAPYLKVGYLTSPDCCLRTGLSLMNGAAGEVDPFLGILLVPHEDVSSFWIGEYFEYDRSVLRLVQDAFAVENDLETVCAMLTKTSICMPPDITDQIKLAAQTNLLRSSVIDKAKQLVYTRAPYRNFGARYQTAGLALDRMVDACKRCSRVS